MQQLRQQARWACSQQSRHRKQACSCAMLPAPHQPPNYRRRCGSTSRRQPPPCYYPCIAPDPNPLKHLGWAWPAACA